MVFEHIEKLKQRYTDKYVIVDESRPELRRFSGQTGLVRTVNMNGRALVEFDGHLNIGWYDIEIDYLKVIDKPLSKEDEKKKAPATKKAPAAKKTTKEPSELEKARASDGKKTAGQMSIEDVLAAARGDAQGGPVAAKPSEKKQASPKKEQAGPAKTAADPSQMSVADVLAAARAEKDGSAPAEEPAATVTAAEDITSVLEAARKPKRTAAGTTASPKVDPTSMSVSDVLAAARAEKGDAEEPAATEEPEPVEQAEEEIAEEPAVEEPADSGPLPTELEDIIAWCRQHDGG